MHPVLFSIGGHEVRLYSVMAVLAMFGAMAPVAAEARRWSWDLRDTMWLVVQCTVFGFIGSHVLYAFTRFDLPSDQWWRMLIALNGGNVWFGGFLASWAWCRWWAKKRGIPGLRMDDVAAFAVLIANPTGRIGCFFNGCCFGVPTTLPWGIELSTRDFGLARLHPVPLYETIYQYALFAVLWTLRRKNTRDGQTAARYLVFMPLGRFALEFLRGDSVRGFVVGWLSTSQFIALFLMAAGVGLHLYLKRRPDTAKRR